MSLKVKLISCISLFMLMLGVLIIGVFAATQTINLKGTVEFNVEDTSLYVKDIRLQTEPTGEAETIDNFMPGYTNATFDLNLGIVSSSSGSIKLYLDFINTTSTTFSATASGGRGVTLTTDGIINGDSVPIANVSTYEGISGTVTLTIQFNGSMGSVSLDGIVITLEELNILEGLVVYVSNVTTKTDTSEDTITELKGGRLLNGSIDLSNITFNTGETTLTISMTSLNANYIKNRVTWVNTSGVTISSTSLYLSQNPSEELTSGTSKDLTITVNNTGSATQISGLEVEFEEKEDLLQVTEEGEVSEYTEEGYWYVEMGTYSTTSDNAEGKRESEYLRWRYFAEEETPYNADTETAPVAYHYEFDRNTRPTGEGYFILETWIQQFYANGNATDLGVSWNNDYKNSSPYKHQLNGWTNIDANDYSTSTIRQYINGNTVQKSAANQSGTYVPSGASTNMFEYFNIDPDNDIIYTDIIGRTLGDLYTDMSNSTTNPQDVDFPKGSPDDWTGATITYSREDTDKFWLLSYYEAYHLLGADTTGSDTDRSWGYSYWLRSNDRSCYRAYDVSMTGYFNTNTINLSSSARAAFKLSI